MDKLSLSTVLRPPLRIIKVSQKDTFTLYVHQIWKKWVPTRSFHGGVNKSTKGRHQQKKTFSFGRCPNKGGGVYPCPEFLAPFFYQVIVLKIAFFYSNFTVIVCFLVIFVRIIIKITIIIIATFIMIIKFFSGHTPKTSFLT